MALPGPVGVLIRTSGTGEALAVARSLQGQLTATLYMEDDDRAAAQALRPVLEPRVAQLRVNSVPQQARGSASGGAAGVWAGTLTGN